MQRLFLPTSRAGRCATALCRGLWSALCIGGAPAVQPWPSPTPIMAAPLTQSPALHLDAVPLEILRLGDKPLLQYPLQQPSATDPEWDRALQQLRADAAAEALAGARRGKLKKPPAAWWLGLIQLHGAGVDQDRPAARASFEQARRLGFGLASAGLAWCAIDGCSGAPDVARARHWISELRPHAPARALFLEWLLASRLEPLRLPRSGSNHTLNEGAWPHRELLLKSAQGGDPQALNELGLESMAAGRRDEALRYFKAASPRSDAATANLKQVQEMLMPTLAASSAPPAAADALLAEAQRFHRGDGRVANYSEAIRLYRMASVQGSAAAQRMLALIYARPSANGGLDLMWMQQLSGLDVGSDLPKLGSTRSRSEPQRDPTPLFDMLPPQWRQRGPFLTR